MLLNTLFGLLGGALMGFSMTADSYEMIIVGRLIVGFHCGAHAREAWAGWAGWAGRGLAGREVCADGEGRTMARWEAWARWARTQWEGRGPDGGKDSQCSKGTRRGEGTVHPGGGWDRGRLGLGGLNLAGPDVDAGWSGGSRLCGSERGEFLQRERSP